MKRFLFSLFAVVGLVLAPLHASDLSITAANVVPSAAARKSSATAGATVAAGQLIYIDASDSNKAKLADTDSATAAVRTVAGIAVNSAASGQTLEYVYYDPALAIGSGRTANMVLIASATAGGIAPVADLTTGWYLNVIGVVKTTGGTIFFQVPGLATGVAQ